MKCIQYYKIFYKKKIQTRFLNVSQSSSLNCVNTKYCVHQIGSQTFCLLLAGSPLARLENMYLICGM